MSRELSDKERRERRVDRLESVISWTAGIGMCLLILFLVGQCSQ